MMFIMERKKEKRKENLTRQWKIKAIRPDKAVHPVAVMQPQDEGAFFASI